MASFDNSGNGPLQVPGFGSIALDYDLPREARFAHGLVEFRHTPRLTAREMAMLRVMQRITEQPGWHQALLEHNEARLAQWHREAQAEEGFLLSAAAWDWCVAELRDKAQSWEQTGRMVVFNTSTTVCQSDVRPVQPDIQREVARLWQQTGAPVCGTAAVWCHIVDPSLFPLIYGRTRVLANGGTVRLEDPWSIRRQQPVETAPTHVHPLDQMRFPAEVDGRTGQRIIWRSMGAEESCWSNRFQWLPCEVEFDASSTPDAPNVRITSYVNNLHPHHHQAMYAQLERLISLSVPTWNEVLSYGIRGRHPPRILTYGCHIEYQICPDWTKRLLAFWSPLSDEELQEMRDLIRDYLARPEPPRWKQAVPRGRRPADLLKYLTPEKWAIQDELADAVRTKCDRLAWFDHPEPGVSFSYEQWKEGWYTGRAIIPQAAGRYPDPLHHGDASVTLEEEFKKDGLQVVVQISRIDLTPEKPTYEGEAHFHTEGLRNEHIVATTMYVVEAENITQPRVSFQHEDKTHPIEYKCEESDVIQWILDAEWNPDWDPYWENFDWNTFDDPDWNPFEDPEPKALHTFGSVPASEGHLLSWPNTLRSKEESFSLQDSSRPGHLTVIKLYLVDPHYRICSTRNVPPQQHDWWAEVARSAADLDIRLPPELVSLVMEQTDCSPVSTTEALRLREEFCREQEHVRQVCEDAVGHHQLMIPYSPTVVSEYARVYESP
ncbi:hypothetical protein MPDQ_002040 [Monascus purpureus]|uniref:Uncharacterized protein n=1 Tax=Monascus purpureus TaxID=5098 RepID=A0A507R497_MONPU|nr:hypothetical protein MPDQ_002040 [Monascus purpureus]BDD56300.1 hypothetical protein MAP00_001772 [Monascus purpureus]